MSFSLLGGVYDSASEDEDEIRRKRNVLSASDDDDSEEDSEAEVAGDGEGKSGNRTQLPGEGDPWGSGAALAVGQKSILPSPLDMFKEVKGPPSFLDPPAIRPIPGLPSGREVPSYEVPRGEQHSDGLGSSVPFSAPAEIKTAPAGAVISAKAQVVKLAKDWPSVEGEATDTGVGAAGSNILAPLNSRQVVAEKGVSGTNRVYGVLLPPKEDASQLLRVCDRCGIPKTFSTAFGGVVCPQCKDRPAATAAAAAEKGGGVEDLLSAAEGGDGKRKAKVIKDKEKSKRMRGQSTHATWKSETEMHLRQQFD